MVLFCDYIVSDHDEIKEAFLLKHIYSIEHKVEVLFSDTVNILYLGTWYKIFCIIFALFLLPVHVCPTRRMRERCAESCHSVGPLGVACLWNHRHNTAQGGGLAWISLRTGSSTGVILYSHLEIHRSIPYR